MQTGAHVGAWRRDEPAGGPRGTIYAPKGQPRAVGRGWGALGGEGQKLVAPGVRSVASKPSQSGFPFSASRKATATPSLQMLAECRRHPPTHTQCHIAGASHAPFPLPRMPFLSSAGKLPHLWLKVAPRGPSSASVAQCRARYLGQRPAHGPPR